MALGIAYACGLLRKAPVPRFETVLGTGFLA